MPNCPWWVYDVRNCFEKWVICLGLSKLNAAADGLFSRCCRQQAISSSTSLPMNFIQSVSTRIPTRPPPIHSHPKYRRHIPWRKLKGFITAVASHAGTGLRVKRVFRVTMSDVKEETSVPCATWALGRRDIWRTILIPTMLMFNLCVNVVHSFDGEVAC